MTITVKHKLDKDTMGPPKQFKVKIVVASFFHPTTTRRQIYKQDKE
tara:strand:+ start:287 stop:424 length:138 start_codon:yes stop_codon:yes gene_type:complete